MVPEFLPEDWRAHLDVAYDGITLKVRGEQSPVVAFLYADGKERDAIIVTDAVKQGLPYAKVFERVRTELLARAADRAKARMSS